MNYITGTFQRMHLVGHMVHLAESDSIMFLGSPMVGELDELMGKGIYLSDIPFHDATRDVVLMSEQTKAQVRVLGGTRVSIG